MSQYCVKVFTSISIKYLKFNYHYFQLFLIKWKISLLMKTYIVNYGYICESAMLMSFAFFVLSNIVVSIYFVKVFFELGSFLIYVPPEGRFRKHQRKANRRFAFFHLHKQIVDLLLSSDSWIFLRSYKD